MRKFALLILAGMALLSCSTLETVSDYDKSVDFAQYKTLEYWGWADESDKILSRFDKERIENAFAQEFEKRGVEVVEKGKGDMIVSLFIIAEYKTSTKATTNMDFGGYGTYQGYGPGYGWGGGNSTTTFDEYNYTLGTLVVAAYDATKKELIWKSIGRKTVDEDPETREKKVGKTIARIMMDYPVKPLR